QTPSRNKKSPRRSPARALLSNALWQSAPRAGVLVQGPVRSAVVALVGFASDLADKRAGNTANHAADDSALERTGGHATDHSTCASADRGSFLGTRAGRNGQQGRNSNTDNK